MKPTKLLSLLTVAMLVACGGDDDGETTNNTTNSTTVTTAGTEDSGSSSAGTTMTSTTMTSTTEPGESSTSPGESSTEPGTEDTAPDSSSGGTGGDCPMEPDDDECATCTKMNCCAELMACQANPDCDCVVQCVGDMGIGMQMACMEMCMVDELPPEATPLQTCVATMGCLASCA